MDSSSALFTQLTASQPIFLMAGPNVIESEEHMMKMAKHIKATATKLGGPLIFKYSFDKANRTSTKSFRGPGIDEGLKILGKVKTDLLVAAAKTGRIINVKRGQYRAPTVTVNSADEVLGAGNQNVMVCERRYIDLIVDPRNFLVKLS